MAKKTALKRFRGVYVTESAECQWRGRPDRCYWVNFRNPVTRKLVWERCGWASEGWTPEAAQKKRFELLEQDRAGEYKPKRERKIEATVFGEFWEGRYYPWAESNLVRFKDELSRYKKWIKPRLAGLTLPAISPLHVEGIKKDIKEAGRSDTSVRLALTLIRQVFNKAKDWGLFDGENPCSKVRFPKSNNAREKYLSYEEADLLIKTLYERSPQTARIAKLSLYSGMRQDEIFRLEWGHVDIRSGIITLFDTKNRTPRHVYITQPIKEVLSELTPGGPTELLFKSNTGKKIECLSKSYARTVEELAFNSGVTDSRQRVNFHTLRHTFASWCVISGQPLYSVGSALGHKSHVMTQRYSHLSPQSQRAAFEAVARACAEAGEAENTEKEGTR